jgi:hypothetical protein
MITYLPDGREVTVTQAPGPAFRAVFAGDPGGVSGYGASADAAIERLLALEGREALYRKLTRTWDRLEPQGCSQCGGGIPETGTAPDHHPARGTIHHIDGNPYNNDPGNLQLADTRENFRAASISQNRLENGYSELP